jgi:hypothetical protein
MRSPQRGETLSQNALANESDSIHIFPKEEQYRNDKSWMSYGNVYVGYIRINDIVTKED